MSENYSKVLNSFKKLRDTVRTKRRCYLECEYKGLKPFFFFFKMKTLHYSVKITLSKFWVFTSLLRIFTVWFKYLKTYSGERKNFVEKKGGVIISELSRLIRKMVCFTEERITEIEAICHSLIHCLHVCKIWIFTDYLLCTLYCSRHR